MTKKSDNSADIWKPCFTPFQGESLFLDFNFWMRHRYVSDAELMQVIESILLKSERPNFLDSRTGLRNLYNVIVVTAHGLSPDLLSEMLANRKLPFLSMSTSVPVRHSLSATMHQLPQTCNISIPDNSWRYTDAFSMSSLLLWPVVPAVTFHDISCLQGNIAAIFRKYRLLFGVSGYCSILNLKIHH